MVGSFSVFTMKAFNSNISVHRYGQWLWGAIVPLVLTFIDWPFRHILTPSNILLVYLLGVFFVAIRLGLFSSILASLTSAASFAFFFAPPIFSFAIADAENLVGLAVMLIVGAVTSNLAQNVRHQVEVVKHKERRVSALYSLSKALAEARLEKEIIHIGVRHLYAEFGKRNTLLFPNSHGVLCYPTDSQLNISLPAVDLKMAQQAFTHRQMMSVLNTAIVYVPLNGSLGTLAVLAIEHLDFQKTALAEQRQLLDTFLNQIVHTLERTALAEQAKEATLKIQAESLRNSLLSSISHDLRTPLATIVCAASTLETDMENLSSEQRENLARAISEEAQRMSELTSKILEMARLEAGEVVLNRQWYAPEEIIGCALARLDKKLKNRPVNVHIADNLVLIYVDVVLLQQVLMNLLENAVKYSLPDSPIDITVENFTSSLSIAVADRGVGIPENLQEKIFDKFFRIQKESAQSGVGLGLSICRAIVEAHGGKIQATQRSGGGTVFQLHLPLLKCPPTIINTEEKG
jgi:two-component system sensor histidine kinase KdpD